MRRTALAASFLIATQLFAQSIPWHYEKVDPATRSRIIEIDAKSFDQTADGHLKYLHNMTAKLYNANGSVRQITSKEGIADMNRATLTYGPGLKSVISLKNP